MNAVNFPANAQQKYQAFAQCAESRNAGTIDRIEIALKEALGDCSKAFRVLLQHTC